ncbi:MAG: hypothetical protein IPP60_11030 [Sphingobacteriales bacterium]|nr:hypothetical protein [Sphingobacteriales bacterium]
MAIRCSTSDMPGGWQHGYLSTKKGEVDWSTPKNVGPDINTEGREDVPL